LENHDWMRDLKLNTKNEIIILKLGGSLLTDKNKPKSIREDVIKSAVQQIIDANVKLFLIHGGGSFGHPLAKQYAISKGIDSNIKNQIIGLTKTHYAMNELNSFIVNLFLEKGFPTLSIQPSSIFIKNSNDIYLPSIDIIEMALNLNILPILYGDILLDTQGSFSILSGDQIIFNLCASIKKFQISKVIFTMETDGIYIIDKEGDKNNPILATDLYSNQLEFLNLANLEQKIDVTGGIVGKINSIKQICDRNIPVQLINGLKHNYIYKSLKNQKINCTNVLIDS